MLLRALVLLCLSLACFAEAPKKTLVKVDSFFQPNNMENIYTQQLVQFMQKNPQILLEQWGGISLPGGKSSLMMAIAGKTAPDVGLSWFHIIRNEISQDFLYPLNEWIGEDTNGNGEIDDSEAKWPGWKKIPPLLRKVATVDGKVYGLPLPVKDMVAIIYRVDLVSAAGLDPNNPPKTWDELLYWCYKLTDTNRIIPGAITQQGQKGICLPASGYLFLPWIQSAGGDPIIQIRKSPKNGKEYPFPLYETKFITPEGENLSKQPSQWRANFDSPEAIEAISFLYQLRWGKWLNIDGEPITLKDAIKKGIEYSEEDIITGVARTDSGGQRGEGMWELLGRGEVAMVISMVTDLSSAGTNANIDPSLLSWFPYPAAPGPKGQRVIQTQNHYAVMYIGTADRSKAERDAIWKTMTAICDEKVIDTKIESQVLSGMSKFVSPENLKRLGYEEYIRDIPLAIRQNFTDIEKGNIKAYTEPWTGFWFLIDMAMNSKCLGIMLGSKGEDFHYKDAIIEVNRQANSGLMFALPESELAKWRPLAFIILAVLLLAVAYLGYRIVKSFMGKRKAGARSVYNGYLPFLLILPAILIIVLWRYYPLGRGLVMAFQDYKVTGNSIFVGLDNFINLALDKSFWMSMWRTVYFVILNMLFAFTAPIILAIMLTEIRHFKILFRTLFFLPQMTSGLVIALMWKLMYNPTPAGFFNQLIAYLNYLPFVDIKPQAWLQDPSLAMICCIIPTVWAGMGMSSLIYLAALHSLPKELYEAAEVDGAGFRSKLWNITIPTLLPLIIINFVGTFIATFQGMGNIFLMTFGGPGEATTVIGLKIWIEAYANLRFSMATAMACVLGSLLIGLTYVQIQFLSKVEYKRAAD